MGYDNPPVVHDGVASAPWSVRTADSVMRRAARLADRWRYESGVALQGIAQVWRQTGDARYGEYIRANIDEFVAPDGTIRTYQQNESNLDQINQGKLLFPLYRETSDQRYRRVAVHLREQVLWQPRTSEGGFWHKLIYPFQMWLDGVYMAGPFMTEYAALFDEPELFDEAAQEILVIEQHTRDPQTGLLYHGWDERRRQRCTVCCQRGEGHAQRQPRQKGFLVSCLPTRPCSSPAAPAPSVMPCCAASSIPTCARSAS